MNQTTQAHTATFSHSTLHLKTEDSVSDALWVVSLRLRTVYETSLASVALHHYQNP
jgi:hypothetical protein